MYLGLWGGTALVCVGLVGSEMIARTRRVHDGLAEEMLQTAVEQFLPATAAGVLLTVVLLAFVSAATWMLPGLWQIIVGLGVFASWRFLPPAILWVGAWYLTAGLGCLALAQGAPCALAGGDGRGLRSGTAPHRGDPLPPSGRG